MPPERPTFSPMWHRVRALKPRLRPHVQITRQHYRGRRWHVVHDPTSNQFYRLNPIAHEMVGLLDGRRTVEEVWTISLERHGDAAPTQGEVVELMAQLSNANLLSADTTPETEQLLRRGQDRLRKKIAQQAIGIMYFRVRLFNPDRLITWLEPIVRPLINRWGLMLWIAWVVAALVALWPEWDQLSSEFERTIAPSNWGWLIVVFVVTKAIHEFGHGVICKRFGGQVPELGIMLLVLFPAPYVDASACWAFPSKWKRIAVGAGGMIFELATAAAAAWAWKLTMDRSDLLVHKLAYNAMFTASISTLLFNANPLMRFDGYYILSDLIEAPNLMQRSMNMIKHLFKRFMYGLKNDKAPTTIPTERAILIVYGLAALAYRVFLFFSITLFVMGKMFAIGLLLAVWTAGVWFVMPTGKFVHWLATGPNLSESRSRAIGTSIVAIAAVVLAVGAIPMPDSRIAPGVVQSASETGVFFGSDGFVEEVHKRPGDRVRAGEEIARLSSPDLLAQVRFEESELRRMESVMRASRMESPAAANVAEDRVEAQKQKLRQLEARVERLSVVAPHDGVVVGQDPARLIGAYVERGQPLCQVTDTERVRIAASLSTVEAAPVLEVGEDGVPVEVRRLAEPGVVHGGVIDLLEPADRILPHPSFGPAGGGTMQMDPQDQQGLLARDPQFTALIEITGDWRGAPGERVRVCFVLPPQPLLHQWYGRLHRLVQGRVKL